MTRIDLAFRTLVLAVAVLSALTPRPAVADATAERVDAFAEFATSAPDEAAIRAFVTANWSAAALAERPVEERLPTLRTLFADLANGVVDGIRLRSVTEAELIARDAARTRWFTIAITLDDTPARAIVRLGLSVDDRPPGQEEPEPSGEGGPLTRAEAVKLLDEEIARRVASDRFSGVAIVERGGERLYATAAGFADRERKLPVTLDTKFAIASIGKAFTATLIHQLAAQGKLDLDAPLASAWPDSPIAEIARRVTIRQLLDHTAGTGDFTEALYSPKGAALGAPRALADYLPLFRDEPLRFEPGSRSRYSNTGYLILGLLIEKLTGKSYFDAVRERIFVPAGMSSTGFAAAIDEVPNRAIGYFRGEGGGALVANTKFERGAGTSAGGGFSTAGDLLRFASALADGKLLPAGTSPFAAGMGIAGGTPAANGVLLWGGGEKPRIVVLTNVGEPAAESFERYLRQVLARIR